MARHASISSNGDPRADARQSHRASARPRHAAQGPRRETRPLFDPSDSELAPHITDYHAKYFAHELTKRCSSDSMEKLAGAVAGAQVDLNPHQVDAALFAFTGHSMEIELTLRVN